MVPQEHDTVRVHLELVSLGPKDLAEPIFDLLEAALLGLRVRARILLAVTAAWTRRLVALIGGFVSYVGSS